MQKIFDIVVDAQNDFMHADGKLYVPGAEAIISALNSHIVDLKSVGVLFTFDTHHEGVYEASEEAKAFPIHCVKGSHGHQLAVLSSPPFTVPVYSMEKGVFDMWQEPHLSVTGLEEILDREIFFTNLKNSGVTKVRVTGVAADYCVKWAIDGLLARGFTVEVVGTLTVGIQRDITQVIKEEYADRDVTII